MTAPRALFPALIALALASLAVALATGSVAIPAERLWAVLTGDATPLDRSLVLELRLPRALAAFAVGGLLALAGALMQVLLRNPLADPYILGISGGAACAALGAMLLGLGGAWISGSAFAGALLAMLLVFALGRGAGDWSPTRLLLTGVVIAAGWWAISAPAARPALASGSRCWPLGSRSACSSRGSSTCSPTATSPRVASASSSDGCAARSTCSHHC